MVNGTFAAHCVEDFHGGMKTEKPKDFLSRSFVIQPKKFCPPGQRGIGICVAHSKSPDSSRCLELTARKIYAAAACATCAIPRVEASLAPARRNNSIAQSALAPSLHETYTNAPTSHSWWPSLFASSAENPRPSSVRAPRESAGKFCSASKAWKNPCERMKKPIVGITTAPNSENQPIIRALFALSSLWPTPILASPKLVAAG